MPTKPAGSLPRGLTVEMASEPIVSWLGRQRRKHCAAALALSALALVVGLAFFSLTFGFCCFLALLIAPVAMAASPRLWLVWPLGLAALAMVLLFIDSARSRRDDLSNLGVWLMRESLGLGPRLLLESFRCGRRALGLARLDVGTCAEVLLYLAARNKSVSGEELRRAFPGLAWAGLLAQLRLLEGVLFLKADFSRVTLSAPLRLRLRPWVVREAAAEEPAPEPEPAEPPPVTEPEKLSPHELLGVSPQASLAEIKAAYRARVKECHPDRFASMDQAAREMAEEWTKALNGAYAELLARRSGGAG